jgi:outer membrane protein assembly factor BamA
MIFPDCSDLPGEDCAKAQSGKRIVRRVHRHGLGARMLSFAFFALVSATAWAFDPFTVRDIQVEGVQRTEAGTIFSYLPIKVGERIDDQKVADAVKALYATGFFATSASRRKVTSSS